MKKILLVDDDERVRKTLRIHLKKAGFDVHEALDGSEGWECFQHGSYDIVISDIRMPKINGAELCKKIRAMNPDVPILVLSGFMESSVVDEALSNGANAYLTKPIQKQELLDKIESIIL